MDCALTCILVLVVSMSTAGSCEFAQNCQQSVKRFYEFTKIGFFCFKLLSLNRIPFVPQIFVGRQI